MVALQCRSGLVSDVYEHSIESRPGIIMDTGKGHFVVLREEIQKRGLDRSIRRTILSVRACKLQKDTSQDRFCF